MEKNTVLAMVLSSVILMMWFWMKKPVPPPQESQVVQSSQEVKTTVSEEAVINQKAQDAGKSMQEEKIVIDTKRNIIELTSRGAAIGHWYTKEKEALKEDMPDMVLINESGALPLKVSLAGASDFSDVIFTVKKSPDLAGNTITLEEGQTARVQFDYYTDSKLQVSKVYSFSYDGALQNFKVILGNNSKEQKMIDGLNVTWGTGLGITGEGASEKKKKTNGKLNNENFMDMKVLSYLDGKLRHKLNQSTSSGDISWTGIVNRYFVSALINTDRNFNRLIIDKYDVKEIRKTIPLVGLGTGAFELKPSEAKVFNLDLFVGLKDPVEMKKLGINLEQIINYGWLDPLSKLFLGVLKFFYSLTRNYGIAIILLTCLLQVVMFPLSKKSMQSTQKMKELQGPLKELQVKYKTDPKRLNVETMNLYKSKGINPLGGCLPVVFQIPIFWAFFTMLRGAIELRHAGFLWIPNLSMMDPYYILPILMGISMFFQQRLTAPMGDPAQAKMMMLLPVVFTFMFLTFPAGLTLYWFVNNILTLTQNFIMMSKAKNKRELALP